MRDSPLQSLSEWEGGGWEVPRGGLLEQRGGDSGPLYGLSRSLPQARVGHEDREAGSSPRGVSTDRGPGGAEQWSCSPVPSR